MDCLQLKGQNRFEVRLNKSQLLLLLHRSKIQELKIVILITKVSTEGRLRSRSEADQSQDSIGIEKPCSLEQP